MLNQLKVLGVLKRISDEDCELLGLNPQFARPDWMILQVLPIPPPPVRPSVMMHSSCRCEESVLFSCTVFTCCTSFLSSLNLINPLPMIVMSDNIFIFILPTLCNCWCMQDDLTHQLATIIKHNENLKRHEKNGSPQHILSEFSLLLQFHITAYFDNELPGLPRV